MSSKHKYSICYAYPHELSLFNDILYNEYYFSKRILPFSSAVAAALQSISNYSFHFANIKSMKYLKSKEPLSSISCHHIAMYFNRKNVEISVSSDVPEALLHYIFTIYFNLLFHHAVLSSQICQTNFDTIHLVSSHDVPRRNSRPQADTPTESTSPPLSFRSLSFPPVSSRSLQDYNYILSPRTQKSDNLQAELIPKDTLTQSQPSLQLRLLQSSAQVDLAKRRYLNVTSFAVLHTST